MRHVIFDAKVAFRKGHLSTKTNLVRRLVMDHGWTSDLSLHFFFLGTNLVEHDIYGMY